jgi:uncharacterized protein YjiS (DUF1127 family)
MFRVTNIRFTNMPEPSIYINKKHETLQIHHENRRRLSMTFITDTRTATAAFPRLPSLFAMINVARQRRALRSLDDHALADLGLTRREADAEARRPFWDLPCR